MTLRTKVAEALRAELRRQSEAANAAQRADPASSAGFVFDDIDVTSSPTTVGVEGLIDLEALADAALEARKDDEGPRVWVGLWFDWMADYAPTATIITDDGAVIGESEIVAVALPGVTTAQQAWRAIAFQKAMRGRKP